MIKQTKLIISGKPGCISPFCPAGGSVVISIYRVCALVHGCARACGFIKCFTVYKCYSVPVRTKIKLNSVNGN